MSHSCRVTEFSKVNCLAMFHVYLLTTFDFFSAINDVTFAIQSATTGLANTLMEISISKMKYIKIHKEAAGFFTLSPIV